jgi:predicted neutral ceramidase superfamily lipid hydrolase
MRKNLIALSIGLIAGLLDLIPLWLANAPLFNMFSVLVFWLVCGFTMTNMQLHQNASLNGLLVSLILMLPLSLAVAATNPKDFLPMMSMAVILGPASGFVIHKLSRAKSA